LPKLPDWFLRPSWRERWNTSISQIEARPGASTQPALRFVATSALALALIVGSVRSLKPLMFSEGSGLTGIELDQSVSFTVARFMRENAADPGLVALGEAGVIPYYTRRPVLDLFGLMDPYLSRLPGGRHEKLDLDYVLGRKPRYVVLLVRRDAKGVVHPSHIHGRKLLENAEFRKHYAPLKDFGRAILYRRLPEADPT
jgi:hypothetical protein